MNNPKLTSAEIAALWTQYMSETAGLCVNWFLLQHIEDASIKQVFEYAVSLGRKHLEKVKEFLCKRKLSHPIRIQGSGCCG